MAKRNFNYDHPTYLTPFITTADILATTADTKGRFAAFTSMILKAVQISVITAGTGASNANLVFQRVVSGGTAITTYANVNMTTNAAGFTTNVLATGVNTLSAGDVFSVLKGADAVGVFAVSIEWLIVPGADVTA